MRLSIFAVAAALALASYTYAEPSTDPISDLLATTEAKQADGQDFVDEDGSLIHVFKSGGDPLGDLDEEIEKGLGAARRRSTHKKLAKANARTKAIAGHFTIGPVGNRRLVSKNVQITWYAKHDLLNPQCGDGSWDPTNNSHIGAVMKGWEGGPKCGEFIQLCNPKKKNRCVTVRVVDKCAGCKEDAVDLTQSAFRMLSPSGTLDEGRIHGIEYYTAEKPKLWDMSLFGPVRLRT